MIYTVTLNPSLDYIMDVNEAEIGKTCRSKQERIVFGGKGINVSYVLRQLGIESVCLGFAGGFTGKELIRLVEKEGVKCDFVELENGITRINVKIRGDEMTEINAVGPCIDEKEKAELLSKLYNVGEKDTVVVSGSVPVGCEDLFENILSFTASKMVRTVVDTSGKYLEISLKYRPWVVKPNKTELEDFFGEKLCTKEELVAAAKKLKNMGAENVLVSLGEEGGLLVDEMDALYFVPAINVTAVNTVAAGDSMLAGFISAFDKGSECALRIANACGAAAVLDDGPAKLENIRKLLE